MPFPLKSNYAVLSGAGLANQILGGDEFWAQPPDELEKIGYDWLVTEHLFVASWDTQEIHPHADEFCYAIDGDVTLHLESEDGANRQSVVLRAGSAFLIPRKMWHTAEITSPVRMIFITMGAGTEVRPITGRDTELSGVLRT